MHLESLSAMVAYGHVSGKRDDVVDTSLLLSTTHNFFLHSLAMGSAKKSGDTSCKFGNITVPEYYIYGRLMRINLCWRIPVLSCAVAPDVHCAKAEKARNVPERPRAGCHSQKNHVRKHDHR